MGGSEEHILPSKMALRMAAALQSPGKLCSFSYVLLVFLLFYVLDVVSLTVYDRDTLLNIGSSVAQRKPFTNLICLTETWMFAMVPDSAIELTGFSVHRSDRAKELTGKSRGGGVCFYINNSWCKSLGSPDLEFHMLLCRPSWLPREFTAIIITAVYIPPQANTDQALRELYRNISEQETAHPDAAFVVTGDFNKANFRTIAPKYFQHITINRRGDRILDHCYSPFRDAYKSLPRPPFGKWDHSSVLLLPAYRQKLKREAPALRTIQCWSDQSDPTLQDCFDHVDWDMFRAASDDDIEAYSDSVTCFIRKCIEDIVLTKTIRIYRNQKPWINSDVRSALSTRTSAFKSGNTDDRKQAGYDLRRSIESSQTTIQKQS